MANTAEGIVVGGEDGLDPNDPAGFAAILAERGVEKVKEDTDSPDTSIASGLTVAGPEQAGRGPDGRFISNQEVNAAEETPPPPVTDTSGDSAVGVVVDDPELQEFLAKYDGDVTKALKGAANAQSLIGRRDEEREQERRELAELRGKLEGFMAAGGAATQQPLSNEQVVEIAASRIESVGYEAAATEAANAAHNGDDRAYRSILEQWQIEDPIAAMDFNTDFRIWQRDQRNAATAEAPATPTWMAQAEEKAQVDAIAQVIDAVATERGVAKDSPIIEQMLPALEEMPKNVIDMVKSNDPEAAAAGVRLVMDRATLLAGAKVAAGSAAETAPTSVARKLAGAAVASGALRPAEKTPESPANREEAIKAFKRSIVEAPTTSISSGLTYGPQP